MPTSSALRQFAEEPAAWGELAPDSGYTRPLTDRYCVLGLEHVAEHEILLDPATC